MLKLIETKHSLY